MWCVWQHWSAASGPINSTAADYASELGVDPPWIQVGWQCASGVGHPGTKCTQLKTPLALGQIQIWGRGSPLHLTKYGYPLGGSPLCLAKSGTPPCVWLNTNTPIRGGSPLRFAKFEYGGIGSGALLLNFLFQNSAPIRPIRK